MRKLTASESTSERIRSPMSGLVSCPNCTRAPRNRLILSSRAPSLTDGGGVIELTGDAPSLRLLLIVLRVGTIEFKLICGHIGECGAVEEKVFWSHLISTVKMLLTLYFLNSIYIRAVQVEKKC
jgi:hypothetical protein